MAQILIVDDDEVSRELMGRVLQDAGHEVLYAANGSTALERVHRHLLDVVVTDLAMPSLNGLRLIRALKELHPGLPVIAVSGQNAEQLLLASDYGAVRTLIKPVDRQALLDAVEHAADDTPDVWANAWG